MVWRRLSVDVNLAGRMIPVTVDGIDLLVGEFGSRLWAVEDMCSHAACAFSTDGQLEGSILICDCHGSEFDVFTGDVLSPPADESVKAYPIRAADDGIEVHL